MKGNAIEIQNLMTSSGENNNEKKHSWASKDQLVFIPWQKQFWENTIINDLWPRSILYAPYKQKLLKKYGWNEWDDVRRILHGWTEQI